MVGGLTGGWSRMGEVAHIGLLSALGFHECNFLLSQLQTCPK